MSTSAAAFASQALTALHSALSEASDPQEFLASADLIAGDPQSLLRLPFDTTEPEDLIVRSGSQRAEEGAPEALNAAGVYEFLGPIPRVQAADPRLWSFLAFVTYREYMTERWPLEGEKWKNRVLDRWLMLAAKRSALVRHGIARLWWIAEQTYDPQLKHPISASTKDPYAYTKLAFAREDRLLGIFDREAGQIPGLTFALLDHIAASPKHAAESYVRELLKEVKREYGYREVAVLDDGQLERLLDRLGAGTKTL